MLTTRRVLALLLLWTTISCRVLTQSAAPEWPTPENRTRLLINCFCVLIVLFAWTVRVESAQKAFYYGGAFILYFVVIVPRYYNLLPFPLFGRGELFNVYWMLWSTLYVVVGFCLDILPCSLLRGIYGSRKLHTNSHSNINSKLAASGNPMLPSQGSYAQPPVLPWNNRSSTTCNSYTSSSSSDEEDLAMRTPYNSSYSGTQAPPIASTNHNPFADTYYGASPTSSTPQQQQTIYGEPLTDW